MKHFTPSKTLRSLASGLALTTLVSLTAHADPIGTGWTQVFVDDFSGTSLDTNKWYIYQNTEFKTTNIVVSGGQLEIKNYFNGTNAHQHTGAWINTPGDAFRYGWYEVRLKHGWKCYYIWPTFWIWGGYIGTNSTTELDVSEWNHWMYNAGGGPSQSHHFKNKAGTVTQNSAVDPSAWHTYAVYWTTNQITFFVDGMRQFSSTWPANADQFLHLILSSSPDLASNPNVGEALPSFYVDYVKVWQGGNPGTIDKAPYNSIISITSPANNKIVTATNSTSNLIANFTGTPGLPQKFKVIAAPAGFCSLRSEVSPYKYVCAASAGVNPLIANSATNTGAWEQFIWEDNGDGTFSLMAKANSKYVCADNAGVSPLIANRVAIGGTWEKYTR